MTCENGVNIGMLVRKKDETERTIKIGTSK